MEIIGSNKEKSGKLKMTITIQLQNWKKSCET